MHFQVTPYVKFGDTLTTEFQLNGTSNEGDSEENSEEEAGKCPVFKRFGCRNLDAGY